MKKRYVIMCTVPFGIDDTYFCEYSGVEHKTQKAAKIEAYEAIHNPQVKSVSIYEVYRD